jgi:Flp pilus assembly protein TadG
MRESRGRGRGFSWQRARQDPSEAERGSLTLMLAAMFVMLLALAGIVVDGGAKLAAAENASSAAQEAARAGAGMVNETTAYENGSFVVDRGQAIQAAHQYLAASGYHGTVTTAPGTACPAAVARAACISIQVTVHITQHTKILSLIGIDWMHVNGTATAALVSGVTGPGQ